MKGILFYGNVKDHNASILLELNTAKNLFCLFLKMNKKLFFKKNWVWIGFFF